MARRLGAVVVLVAFGGVFLSHRLQSNYPDAIASISIGLVLAAVAIYLVIQTKHLLLGESADPELVEKIRSAALSAPEVAEARTPLTIHFGPQTIMANIPVTFEPGLDGDGLPEIIDRLRLAVRAEVPQVKWVFIEACASVGVDEH